MKVDYERKYKEAFKAASKWHEDGNDNAKRIVECIFPELKESEDERIRKEIIQSIKDNMCVIHKDKCLAWLEKQGEQNPAWSEEDEETYNEIIDFFLGDIERRCVTIDKQRHFGYWLKSLKDRVQPQPKQEWNAQDEAFLGDAIYAAKNTYGEKCGQEELVDWLKSFKPHNWKPSEEQMKAIKYFIDFHRPQANASTEGWSEFKHLESLYNILKKL